MRVNDPQSSPVGSTGVGRAQQNTAVGPGSQVSNSSSADSSDRVQFSSLSQQLNALAEGSSEREAKLEALRAAVANGSYQADAFEISGKMIDEALRERSEPA